MSVESLWEPYSPALGQLGAAVAGVTTVINAVDYQDFAFVPDLATTDALNRDFVVQLAAAVAGWVT